MASGFWYLKDGRGFARPHRWMIAILEEIHDELLLNPNTKEFADYLNQHIPTEKHMLNGYGGILNLETGENVMMQIDFREFTKKNQQHFWEAAQKRLGKLIKENDSNNDSLIYLMKILLDMNKRAKIGEDPMKLNHMREVKPYSGERKGPGWDD